MKSYVNHIILFIFTVLLMIVISCTRTAQVDLPVHQSRLVLHGYVGVGERFSVSIGRSIGGDYVVEDSNTFVKNAWVVLYVDNQFGDSLRFDPQKNRYVSTTIIAESGRSYKIISGAPGFETVEAIATAPAAVRTLNISHLTHARTSADGVSLDDIVIRFEDPATEKNYYLSALHPAFPGSSYLCVYTYDPSVERYTGDFVPFDQRNCISSEEILYTDKSFNGSVKDITFSTEGSQLQHYTDPVTGHTYRPFFKRYNISEDYYRYFKNVISLTYSYGSPTMSDPVITKGNVKNGYGLFTVFTVTTDTIP